jgi:putative transposase
MRHQAGADTGISALSQRRRLSRLVLQGTWKRLQIEMRDGWRHGHVTLFGIGRMRIRGVARTPGRILKADVVRDAFGWKLNVVVATDLRQARAQA